MRLLVLCAVLLITASSLVAVVLCTLVLLFSILCLTLLTLCCASRSCSRAVVRSRRSVASSCEYDLVIVFLMNDQMMIDLSIFIRINVGFVLLNQNSRRPLTSVYKVEMVQDKSVSKVQSTSYYFGLILMNENIFVSSHSYYFSFCIYCFCIRFIFHIICVVTFEYINWISFVCIFNRILISTGSKNTVFVLWEFVKIN